jgi:hypothetical protein
VPHARLTAPLIPLVMAFGWITLFDMIRFVANRIRLPEWTPGLLLVLFFAFWAGQETLDLRRSQRQGEFPWGESGRAVMAAGDWLKKQGLQNAVVLTQNPWSLNFYSGAKTVRLPEAPLEQVIECARHYRATHIIPDGFNPVYYPWVRGRIGGLKRVFAAPGLELFEIDFTRIKPSGRQGDRGG